MRLGGAGCGVRHQGPFAIAEPRRSDAVSLRSARAALDAAQKTRGKAGVSGENGVGSGGSLAGNENKILVSAGITDYAFSRTAPRKSGPSGATQHKESKLVPATSQIFGRCIRAKRLTCSAHRYCPSEP